MTTDLALLHHEHATTEDRRVRAALEKALDALDERDRRIAELERELELLRNAWLVAGL
jgi:hypothetical protein